MLMSNQIVLLEARKEVTTFLLDDGDITSKEVVTETGQDIGYEYTAKLYPEDTVAISPNSQIGKEMVKKYTGDNDELYFRDYLNEHPRIAKEYEALFYDLLTPKSHKNVAEIENGTLTVLYFLQKERGAPLKSFIITLGTPSFFISYYLH